MAIEPIAVSLSEFEKLAILREELEHRAEELTELEATLRTKLEVVEKEKYLQSLSKYYSIRKPPEPIPTAEEVKKMQERRALLIALIAHIKALIPQVEQNASKKGGGRPASSSGGGGQSAGGGSRKAKFDW